MDRFTVVMSRKELLPSAGAGLAGPSLVSPLEQVMASEAAPVVMPVAVDPPLPSPCTEIDEWRNTLARYRYVHGDFGAPKRYSLSTF